MHRPHHTFARIDAALTCGDDRAKATRRDISAIPGVVALFGIKQIRNLVCRSIKAVKITHVAQADAPNAAVLATGSARFDQALRLADRTIGDGFGEVLMRKPLCCRWIEAQPAH